MPSLATLASDLYSQHCTMAIPYRLGPALLQISEDSSTHAPETFRSALLRALDSPGRVAVALTCKAGLRWLLTEWPDSAALQLTVRPSGAVAPDSATLRRMRRVSQWLSVRGDQPLSLTVKQQGQGPSATGYWQTVLGVLGSGHAAPAGLSLSLQVQHIPPSLLQLVGSTFPGLTTLSLGSVSGSDSTIELPPPASLRALRHLTIHRVLEHSQAALWASAAPYIQQLASLTITQELHKGPDWSGLSGAERDGRTAAWAHTVFNPAAPTTTLTHLSLQLPLAPSLAALLCQCFPALAQLAVTHVECSASTDAVAMPIVCPWRTLVLACESRHEDCFAPWLPFPAEGKLVIDVSRNKGSCVCLCLDNDRLVSRVLFTPYNTLYIRTGLARAWHEPGYVPTSVRKI